MSDGVGGDLLQPQFGWLSIVLAALGIITTLSFLLFLTFPLWVLL